MPPNSTAMPKDNKLKRVNFIETRITDKLNVVLPISIANIILLRNVISYRENGKMSTDPNHISY